MTDKTSEQLDTATSRKMRKVALTALAGTSIEWYDFFLYGTAAALVFPTAFFPEQMSPVVALVASFSTFAVGFIARPVGGIIFGHFGDRIGRKQTLVIALMLMGISTTLVGLLPSYTAIGAAAPLALVLLRFVQGLAIGGQWGGAMLLVTENAPAHKRGYYGAYAQAGAPVGMILANTAFLALSGSMSGDAFIDWGWRIAFIASIALIGISIYVQLHLEDTPAFIELRRRAQTHPATGEEVMPPDETFEAVVAEQGTPSNPSPILDALRLYKGRILLAAGAFVGIQVIFYILAAFVVAYGSSPAGLGLPRKTMLSAVLIASTFQILFQFAAASYSDKHGRRGVYLTGAVLSAFWAFALFPLIETGNFLLITLAITIGFGFMGMQYGPQAAYFAELFSTHVRYSGASLGYQIGAILGGALAPTIAVLLWSRYGIEYVSAYIALSCVVTISCVLRLSETKGADIAVVR